MSKYLSGNSGGKIIETMPVRKSYDQILIRTNRYKSGMYVCELWKGKRLAGSAKFMVSK
jgi:hypothetical protein